MKGTGVYQSMKLTALLIILGLILVIWLFYRLFDVGQERTIEKASVHWVIAGEEVILEIVKTPGDLYKGLSGRETLCDDCGMLFVFPDHDQRSFVMRDMNFPLDIIFLDSGRIIKIYRNVPPEGSLPQARYDSISPSDRVLELKAGKAFELGLKEEDWLDLPE